VNTTEERPEGESTHLPDDVAITDRGSIWIGILSVAIGHVVSVSTAFLLDFILRGQGGIGLITLCCIGLVQLLYVLPLIILHDRRGRARTRNGIQIAAVITLLLNATCFGVVMSTISFR